MKNGIGDLANYTREDQDQEDNTGDDPVPAKKPETVFLQKANKEFDR